MSRFVQIALNCSFVSFVIHRDQRMLMRSVVALLLAFLAIEAVIATPNLIRARIRGRTERAEAQSLVEINEATTKSETVEQSDPTFEVLMTLNKDLRTLNRGFSDLEDDNSKYVDKDLTYRYGTFVKSGVVAQTNTLAEFVQRVPMDKRTEFYNGIPGFQDILVKARELDVLVKSADVKVREQMNIAEQDRKAFFGDLFNKRIEKRAQLKKEIDNLCGQINRLGLQMPKLLQDAQGPASQLAPAPPPPPPRPQPTEAPREETDYSSLTDEYF